jgi:hypothetical protein
MCRSVTIRPLNLTPKRLSNKQAVMIAHLICIPSNLPSEASALQSAISALESEIAALDKSSLSPEFWLPFFTVLVAIGVALEILVVLQDHKEDMEEWELCKLIPDKPSSRKLWLEIASVILVTVGILGELGIGLWISHINGQLRSKNAELRSISDQLVALVNSEAEEATRQAKAADLARVKLEARVEWRHLSEDQKSAFADKLKKYPRQHAEVMYNNGDSEAASFAASIADVLATRAHWEVPPIQPFPQVLFSATRIPTTGVAVQGGIGDSDAAAVKPQTDLLIKLFHDGGFDADEGFTWKVVPNSWAMRSIAIAVKHRPEGPQGEYKLQAERDAKATKKKAQNSQTPK